MANAVPKLKKPKSSNVRYRSMPAPRQRTLPATTNSGSRRRDRGAIACLNCRKRKVRCNISQGAPCSNCDMDMVECVVRRNVRNRKRFDSLLPFLTLKGDVVGYREARDFTAARKNSGSDCPTESGEAPPQEPSSPHKQPTPRSPQHRYCTANSASQPSFIKPMRQDLKSGNINLLRSEGALELPPWPLQRALVEAYAEFAYPYMPLIQLHEFLQGVSGQEDGPIGQTSLLLYQAIMFAGSAFVDKTALSDMGAFSSRKGARTELSRRVTLLYDLGYERDPVTLIQTALLMSSWSDAAHDHKDSWYWMGLAVSSAYSLGLNSSLATQNLPLKERILHRRIWWSCYMRDRFLSLGLRRPTRIKDEDVSVSALEMSDFDFVTLPDDSDIILSDESALHGLERQQDLAELCVHRCRLSVLIGPVLQIQDAYDHSHATASCLQIDQMSDLEERFREADSNLAMWKSSLPASCEYDVVQTADEVAARSLSLAVHQGHIQMAYHTLLYALHRPRVLPSSPKNIQMDHSSPSNPTTSESNATVTTSAIQISSIAQSLQQLHLDEYLPVTGVTIIFPAMVVSLLEMKRKKTTTPNQEEAGRGAMGRFLACMRVMHKLTETYMSANLTIDYFKAALQKASMTISWSDELTIDVYHEPSPTVLQQQSIQESTVEDSIMLLRESLHTPISLEDYGDVASSLGSGVLDINASSELINLEDIGMDDDVLFDWDSSDPSILQGLLETDLVDSFEWM